MRSCLLYVWLTLVKRTFYLPGSCVLFNGGSSHGFTWFTSSDDSGNTVVVSSVPSNANFIKKVVTKIIKSGKQIMYEIFQ